MFCLSRRRPPTRLALLLFGMLFLTWTPNLVLGAVHRSTIIASSWSVALDYASSTDDGGKAAVFSTYDSLFGWPQGFPDNISGEAKPDSLGSSTYRTDFAGYSYYYRAWANFGNIWFTVPAVDSDGDGLPDWLEIDRPVSLSGLTAYVDEEYNAYSSAYDSSATLALTRSAAPARVLTDSGLPTKIRVGREALV